MDRKLVTQVYIVLDWAQGASIRDGRPRVIREARAGLEAFQKLLAAAKVEAPEIERVDPARAAAKAMREGTLDVKPDEAEIKAEKDRQVEIRAYQIRYDRA